ncbi:MAG: family 78 glycoside hydrolase catalytic domain [Candidatus Microbacterium stercoravium]
MRAARLRTEYLREPLGLGIDRPKLSWVCEAGIAQTAYRIVATRAGDVVWDSGKVVSSRTTHIRYDGAPLSSRDRVDWRVTLWNENGSEGETVTSWFELGLLDATDWSAQWITADAKQNKNERRPVDCFRKIVPLRGDVASARLYATAHGLYEARINGTRVGDFRLAPGSTDYRHRLQYQTYDVTELLRTENELELELELADGWFRGSVGCYGQTNVFGRETAVRAQLEIVYADGERERIGTDDTFSWSDDGPLRFADLKDGEVYDARKKQSYGGAARIASATQVPVASDNVEPRQQEAFVPKLIRTPSGARVLDFGQNIAGFIGFTVHARNGQQIRLRLGEMLDERGEFTQANMQKQKPVREFGRMTELLLMTQQEKLIPGELQHTPLQEIVYTCADGINEYKTEFAIFGYRYALIQTDVEFTAEDFRAIAVYSDMDETGDFECSNPAVNRLLENTRWSMKSNFLDVPTDCPTRERLGWTGDAQIFFDTAASLMDVASFYRKWLRDMRDAQEESGAVSAVVPYNGVAMMYRATGGSVGWADAMVLVPYRFWKRYGDASLIREFYPMMRRYALYMIGRTGQKDSANPHASYVYAKGFHLGEWLEPDEFRDSVRGRLPRTEEATAYLHATMSHLVEIARELGEFDDERLYCEYAAGARSAYDHLFVEGGTIDTDRQAKLVRPLALGLLDGDVRARVEKRLVQAVENREYRIGTGFLSTPHVLHMLSEAGRADVAYRMLENEQAPSWLAEVRAGATTIWEDWEGRESRNHYSPGAVCQWLFDTVAGIRVAGENRFVVRPVPGGTLSHASATYLSAYGRVTSSWRRYGEDTSFAITIPPNTRAEVLLPDGSSRDVGAGDYVF